MTEANYAVIAASLRGERMGRAVADWATGRIAAVGMTADLIDLAEISLPDDELLQPGGAGPTEIAPRIDRADAYVIVTPEYNHSYPAGLKRAIDWHYREWMFKPATVLSYGVQGGLLATEHLRGVLAELHVVTTRRGVGLTTPWYDLGPAGYAPPDGVAKAFDLALGELAWWAETLRHARRDRPYIQR
ncbi:NADPH-dependent FMN reductase [Actinoplanes sp. CA-142083]|uniref:NADPH-dependent FMN reductase n=1 Tax=Actinoplanes sp. CA-142083 TaxID=3239903 RepID=UPI003D8A9B8C